MASTTATPQGSVRQRNTGSKKSVTPSASDPELDVKAKSVVKPQKGAKSSDLEYRIGFVVTTVLAFITRFWGISHPNEVVFDEVHFGKVRDSFSADNATFR